ncbi:MAG: hypothetical protein BMS9Abin37_0227 [Acidobacteriota bacterium]|nr:MAG: hypothetical protein BMS9Abin37_0227 [Acidobacteriota bacterium]
MIKNDDFGKNKKSAFRTLVCFTAVLPLAILMGACAPGKDVENIESGLKELRSAQADAYAPAELEAAEKAYQALIAEMDVQSAKSFWSRSYRHAKELVSDADATFKKAKNATEDAREEAHRIADELLTETRQSFEGIDTALKEYPESTQKAFEKKLETIRTTILDGEKAFDEGDYLDAQSKAEDAKALADELSVEIRGNGPST